MVYDCHTLYDHFIMNSKVFFSMKINRNSSLIGKKLDLSHIFKGLEFPRENGENPANPSRMKSP